MRLLSVRHAYLALAIAAAVLLVPTVVLAEGAITDSHYSALKEGEQGSFWAMAECDENGANDVIELTITIKNGEDETIAGGTASGKGTEIDLTVTIPGALLEGDDTLTAEVRLEQERDEGASTNAGGTVVSCEE